MKILMFITPLILAILLLPSLAMVLNLAYAISIAIISTILVLVVAIAAAIYANTADRF
jgi:hypothetical protein